jgi:hypothetical protein
VLESYNLASSTREEQSGEDMIPNKAITCLFITPYLIALFKVMVLIVLTKL